MSQISISNVNVVLGGTTIFQDVSFTVSPGDRWGIVGRNGTGKTTLLNVLVGALDPSGGVVTRATGLQMAVLDQHREFGDDTTIWDAAAASFAPVIATEKSLEKMAHAIGQSGDDCDPALLRRYDRELELFQRSGGYTYSSDVDAVLHGLGFDPTEARQRPIHSLSGGERGKIGLARQLANSADVLVMDEPTNHLDLPTIAWLESFLAQSPKTLILISHDRAFLDTVVNRVLHFENNTATPYRGNYSAFVEQRDHDRITAQRAFDKQKTVIAKEADYIRRNIAGQNSKQAKGRRARLARMPRLSPPPEDAERMALRLDTGSRGGNQILVADKATMTIGSRTLLREFSTRLTRGKVVAFVGANGVGKSTLLDVIVGQHQLESGHLEVPDGIGVSYYRQDLSDLNHKARLFDIIADMRPMWNMGQVRSLLARFGFIGAAVDRTVATLSGGERARMALAIMMLSPAHLLLLDEPTNHLDVESIEVLEDALESFPGTAIVVSHDRAFLRAIASNVWSLAGERLSEFDGSFVEWEERTLATITAPPSKEKSGGTTDRTRRTRRDERDHEKQMASARRSTQRQLETAEQEVHAVEEQLAALRKKLEDPVLYTQPDAAAQSQALQAAISEAGQNLHSAMEKWTALSEELEKFA